MALLGLDTHPKAASVQLGLLRQASVGKRAALATSLSSTAVQLSRRALREQMPQATDAEVIARWVTLNYGADLGRRMQTYLRARAG